MDLVPPDDPCMSAPFDLQFMCCCAAPPNLPVSTAQAKCQTGDQAHLLPATLLANMGEGLASDVGSCSQANYLMRNTAMDDSIGGS